jgi:hypothetical protein
MKML